MKRALLRVCAVVAAAVVPLSVFAAGSGRQTANLALALENTGDAVFAWQLPLVYVFPFGNLHAAGYDWNPPLPAWWFWVLVLGLGVSAPVVYGLVTGERGITHLRTCGWIAAFWVWLSVALMPGAGWGWLALAWGGEYSRVSLATLGLPLVQCCMSLPYTLGWLVWLAPLLATRVLLDIDRRLQVITDSPNQAM